MPFFWSERALANAMPTGPFLSPIKRSICATSLPSPTNASPTYNDMIFSSRCKINSSRKGIALAGAHTGNLCMQRSGGRQGEWEHSAFIGCRVVGALRSEKKKSRRRCSRMFSADVLSDGGDLSVSMD